MRLGRVRPHLTPPRLHVPICESHYDSCHTCHAVCRTHSLPGWHRAYWLISELASRNAVCRSAWTPEAIAHEWCRAAWDLQLYMLLLVPILADIPLAHPASGPRALCRKGTSSSESGSGCSLLLSWSSPLSSTTMSRSRAGLPDRLRGRESGLTASRSRLGERLSGGCSCMRCRGQLGEYACTAGAHTHVSAALPDNPLIAGACRDACRQHERNLKPSAGKAATCRFLV